MSEPIQQVVILAAGQGTRLRKNQKDYLKPLYPLHGKPLIAYVMQSFFAAGVIDFYVVVGFCKEELVEGLQEVLPTGARLELIDNPDWKLSNGISLLKAHGTVQGRFFLSMADHIFQTKMVQALSESASHLDCLYLGVDTKLDTIFDMDDATKVVTNNGMIQDIGKELEEFNAVDTGLFVCPQDIFTHLKKAMREGDCSLSDGVRSMAAENKARVADIGAAFWQDVDTPEMLSHAENWLAKHQL